VSPVVLAVSGDQNAIVRSVSDDRIPTVLLRGVTFDSPLGENMTAALALTSRAVFESGGPPELRRWRRKVGGTALQWWSGASAAAASNDAILPDVSLNLHQQDVGRPGRMWCIVDADGAALLSVFQALQACYSTPYIVSLNLIESDDGGSTWHLIGEAHVSSVRGYRELLNVLGRTSVLLVRKGLQVSDAPRRRWIPGSGALAVSRAPLHALLRARVLDGLSWLRARISGEVYGIAVLDRSPSEALQGGVWPVSQWLTIPASQGFIADPFFWPGQTGLILCETYLHHTGLGALTVLSVNSDQITRSAPLPLGLNSHLSYPSTWAEDGRVFCLPEMATSRHQLLYELREGDIPVPVCTIKENAGMADPTLMKVNGLYWICYTDIEIGLYDNLCLLYAERLEGPWRPHRCNPVKLDARSSRPGGMPFWVGERLFRPAQDCSQEYGGALVVNEIKLCTTDEYYEEAVVVLRPDPAGPFPDGLHTLDFAHGRAVIDGKRICYRPSILFHKIFRRLKRTGIVRRLLAH